MLSPCPRHWVQPCKWQMFGDDHKPAYTAQHYALGGPIRRNDMAPNGPTMTVCTRTSRLVSCQDESRVLVCPRQVEAEAQRTAARSSSVQRRPHPNTSAGGCPGSMRPPLRLVYPARPGLSTWRCEVSAQAPPPGAQSKPPACTATPEPRRATHPGCGGKRCRRTCQDLRYWVGLPASKLSAGRFRPRSGRSPTSMTHLQCPLHWALESDTFLRFGT